MGFGAVSLLLLIAALLVVGAISGAALNARAFAVLLLVVLPVAAYFWVRHGLEPLPAALATFASLAALQAGYVVAVLVMAVRERGRRRANDSPAAPTFRPPPR